MQAEIPAITPARRLSGANKSLSVTNTIAAMAITVSTDRFCTTCCSPSERSAEVVNAGGPPDVGKVRAVMERYGLVLAG